MKALAGLTVALVAVASAAPAQDQESSPASGSAITLAAAVETTLRDSFNLQQARESVDNRRGAWQRSSGAFDKLFFIDGDFTFVKQELLRGGRDSEVKRRAPLEYLGGWPTTPPFSFPGWLDVAADEIQDFLNVNGASAFEDCQFGESRNVFDLENPDGVGDQGGSFLDRYRQSTVTLCLDEDGNLRSLVPAKPIPVSAR